MPRTPGAVVAIVYLLALSAHADGSPQAGVDDPPLAVADRAPGSPDASRVPTHKKKNAALLNALTNRLRAGHAALEDHALVVTSGDSEVRTFTYDDAVRSLKAKDARHPAPEETADEPQGRLQLDLPKQPNADGALKFEFTGGLDEVGVLLTKKM
jgi:hypothetical protein